MNYIDLFAGLGGFHLALEKLGHKCVFASEINTYLQSLYIKNFPDTWVDGDITKTNLEEIPSHSLLCAGFPCQPFSVAGLKKGFKDEKKGNLFFEIMKVIKVHSPEYLILENVQGLLHHGGNVQRNNLKNSNNSEGETLRTIRKLLEDDNLPQGGYEIAYNILSPDEFGIPQHRKRIFIVARLRSKGGLKGFEWPKKEEIPELNIFNGNFYFDKNIDSDELKILQLNKKEQLAFEAWNYFVNSFPKNKKIPSFPLWSHEWGATYPFESKIPLDCTITELLATKGSFGKKIQGDNKKEILLEYLPKYAYTAPFSDWKFKNIKKNREFYLENKGFLDSFKKKLYNVEFSWQKLEWSCQNTKYSLSDKIIQFRQSGVRVKRNHRFPTLTTASAQVPYVPKLKRRLSCDEMGRLQSMGGLKYKPLFNKGARKAYGNAVNTHVVYLIAKNLLKNIK